MVVGVPARSMFALTVKGTPWNGGSSRPSATARSAALAASSACSPRTMVTALIDRVHGLDPPQVGLDDFSTGGLPGSDCPGQLRGAHRQSSVVVVVLMLSLLAVARGAAERPLQPWPPRAHQARR